MRRVAVCAAAVCALHAWCCVCTMLPRAAACCRVLRAAIGAACWAHRSRAGCSPANSGICSSTRRPPNPRPPFPFVRCTDRVVSAAAPADAVGPQACGAAQLPACIPVGWVSWAFSQQCLIAMCRQTRAQRSRRQRTERRRQQRRRQGILTGQQLAGPRAGGKGIAQPACPAPSRHTLMWSLNAESTPKAVTAGTWRRWLELMADPPSSGSTATT